jgi:hypothetical protein
VKTGIAGTKAIAEEFSRFRGKFMSPLRKEEYNIMTRFFIWLLVVLLSAFAVPCASALEFDFNNGTNQGWTYAVYGQDTGVTTDLLQGPGPLGWYDQNNYPNVFGDPADSNGSAAFGYLTTPCYGSQYDWIILRFISPDLSGMPQWQTANGFTAQVMNAALTPDLTYTNLWMVIHDNVTATDRSFYNGTAATNDYYDWTSHSFNDLSGVLGAAMPAVTDYSVKQVMVYFWYQWPTGPGIEGGFYLDNVLPIAGVGPGPGPGQVPEPSTMLLLCLGMIGLAGLRKKM